MWHFYLDYELKISFFSLIARCCFVTFEIEISLIFELSSDWKKCWKTHKKRENNLKLNTIEIKTSQKGFYWI